MVSLPLARPGVVYLAEEQDKRVRVLTGPSAGWMVPKGILNWSNEVALISSAALTDEVIRTTKGVHPVDQIAPSKYPLSSEAAKASRLMAVSGRITTKLIEAGVRVHTVGYDRVSGGFYYLAEGGGEEPARFEGELIATLAEGLGDGANNDALDRGMLTIVDRLLTHFSKSQLDELSVELAASLPRYAADGSGMEGVDLDAFEKSLSELVGRSEKHFTELELFSSLVERAPVSGHVDVPLMGTAQTDALPALTITAQGQQVTLPQANLWFAVEGATPSKQTEALERPTTNLEVAPVASQPQASPRPASQPPMPAAPPRPASNRPAPAAAAAGADAHKPTMMGLAPNAEELAMLDDARKKMEEAAAEKARAAEAAKAEGAAKSAKVAAEAKAAEEAKVAAQAKAAADAKAAEEAKTAADVKAAEEAKAVAEAKATADAKAAEEAKAAAEAKAGEEAKAAKAAKEAKETEEAKAAEAKKAGEKAADAPVKAAEKRESKAPPKAAASAEAAKAPMEKSGNKTWMIAVAVILVAVIAYLLKK